ncbi:protocadherin Fat 1-like isoform X1 [Panthera leo]|uniref:protocadherin Fat 1-like isoform X1 n=2 Tax=Panthera leo TaxID=9689 RepID=UPI001C6A6401|nr:protocadherin Fat 1-like isoform X1 [Panthera leo]
MARKTEGISSYGAMKRLGIGDQPKADNKSRSLYSWKAARTSDPNTIDTDYYPGSYDIESDFLAPAEEFPVPDELPSLPLEFSDQFQSMDPPGDILSAASCSDGSACCWSPRS